MKTEFVREYKRKIRLILISKLNGKNKTKAINSWTVAIIRYGAGVLEWKFDKLKELDRKTRKVKKIILDGTFRIRMKMKHVRILKFRESVSKKDFKKSLNEKRVENWKEKQMSQMDSLLEIYLKAQTKKTHGSG